jgi:hypothetical protein
MSQATAMRTAAEAEAASMLAVAREEAVVLEEGKGKALKPAPAPAPRAGRRRQPRMLMEIPGIGLARQKSPTPVVSSQQLIGQEAFIGSSGDTDWTQPVELVASGVHDSSGLAQFRDQVFVVFCLAKLHC